VNRRDGVDTGRSVRRRIRMVGVLLAVAAVVGYASTLQVGAAAPGAAGPQVEIKHHKYSPTTLTVPVGTTVTWTNRDDDVHTVVSTAQKFTSRGIDNDESFSQKFTAPGTYEYFCTLHPLMTAKVIVK
jgi:plastocyanin